LTKKPHLVVQAVLVVAIAGCGGDDSDDADGESTAKRNRQDAAAKSDARNLVSAVEVCFVEQQSYTACEKPSGAQLPIGSGRGQVEVSAASDAGYTVVAHSESGTSFKIVKRPTGSVARTCDNPGTGGCRSGGRW
jgi:type IV pilus assembly protein PilA